MSDLKPILRHSDINHSWSLFIDRDGVINQKREKDYVKTWEEFIFISNSLDALNCLKDRFVRMVIVTNQRGVGRNLMTEQALEEIHQKMMEEIEAADGRIDRIYFCPSLEEDDTKGWRKPKIGMALQAQKDFPEIDFQKSIMIGDSISDMQFGRNAGMVTVWVSEHPPAEDQQTLIDYQVKSLFEFSQWLCKESGLPQI